jgi:hypothetical protein
MSTSPLPVGFPAQKEDESERTADATAVEFIITPSRFIALCGSVLVYVVQHPAEGCHIAKVVVSSEGEAEARCGEGSISLRSEAS